MKEQSTSQTEKQSTSSNEGTKKNTTVTFRSLEEGGVVEHEIDLEGKGRKLKPLDQRNKEARKRCQQRREQKGLD